MKKILCILLIFLFFNSCASAKQDILDFDTLIKKADMFASQKKYAKAAKILKNIDKEILTETQKNNIQEKQYLYAFLSHFKTIYDPYTHSMKYVIKDMFPGQIECAVIQNNETLNFYMLIKIMHSSSTWLFPKTITVLYDGNTFSFTPQIRIGDNVNCSSRSCSYNESRGAFFAENDLKYWKAIAVSNNTSMRIYGEYHYKDFKILETNKNNINRMIDLYYFLKNGGQI